ncbi:hypothetical protein ACFS07_22465 [Undibacterium arcticum]
MTLLVHEQSQVELIKLQMPQVRNRLLMVLSSKKRHPRFRVWKERTNYPPTS